MASYILQSDLPAPRRLSLPLRRWIAAACFILLGGIGFAVYKIYSFPSATPEKITSYKNDVPPGSFKAKLTLSNGQTISLDSSAGGKIAAEGGTCILNAGGTLRYQPTGTAGQGALLNTLTTAAGETYATVLSDGTKVWLIASSSITYPVQFTGDQRLVLLSGEGYFEVTHDSHRPFTVQTAKQTVEDIGTAFNVNAYPDERMQKTTLAEGSSRVSSPGQPGKLLEPGQQAQLEADGKWTVIPHADVEEALGWKNGLFLFDNTDIRTIMTSLSRWYGLSVVYKGKTAGARIHLEAGRNTSLQSVLKVLELTSGLHFSVEGRQVTVRGL